MNSIDYGQKLESLNAFNKRKIDSVTRDKNETISDLKESYEQRAAENAKNYKEAKSKLEQSHIARVDQLRGDQAKSLQDKSMVYNEALSNQKSEINDIRKDELKQWSNKLANLKDTYGKENEILEKKLSAGNGQGDFKAQKRINSIIDDTNSKIQLYKDTTKNQIEKNNYETSKEIARLNDTHKKQSYETNQNAIDTKVDVRNKAEEAVDLANRKSRYESERLNKKIIDTKTIAKRNREDEIAMNNKLNNERFDTLSKKMITDLDRQQDQFNEKFKNQERQNYKDLRSMDLKNQASGLQEGSFTKDVNDMYANQKDTRHKEKIQDMIGKRNEMQADYDKKIIDQNYEFSNEFKKQNMDNNDRVKLVSENMARTSKEQKLNDDKAFSDYQGKTRLKMNNLNKETTQALANEKQLADKKIKNLTETHSKALEKLVIRTNSEMDDARFSSNKEKKELALKMEQDYLNKTNEIKTNYENKINAITQKYEEKIYDMQTKNEQVYEQLTGKLAQSQNKYDTDMKDLQESSYKNLQKEREEWRQATLNQQAENDQEMKMKTKMFDKKVRDTYELGEKKVEKLTNNYESKLTAQKAKYQDIIEQNQKFFDREMELMKMANSDEKNNMIAQYESQIKHLKDTQSAQRESSQRFDSLQKA